jgi:hypothetical protein
MDELAQKLENSRRQLHERIGIFLRINFVWK